MEQRVQRRLAAIVVADVVGYSRLVETDEVATLAVLNERRKTILQPLIKSFRGRAVKFMGDGVLLEFASALDAVEFSIDLQREMDLANATFLDRPKILLRIGVNLGDVIVSGGDVFGDGVNVAARLEPLAEPGGIVVSDAVYRQVRTKLEVHFRDLGELTLKNVSEPVRVFQLRHKDRIEASGESGLRTTFASSAATEKISVAVLPFAHMSDDPKQTYFSDGITEDIITALGRFRELRVVARNSSFQFRGRAEDMREVGRMLAARFVIEGSVRRISNRVRVTAQLVEISSNTQVWADRFDREFVDVFDIQDEITRMVVTRVAGHARSSAVSNIRSRPTDNASAYDHFLQARQMIGGYETSLLAEPFLLQAIRLDPRFAAAHALLADVNVTRFQYTGDRDLLDKAMDSARRAMDIDPEESWSNYALGFVHMYRRSLTEAGFYFRRAISLNENDVYFIAIHAFWLNFCGRGSEAIEGIRDALRRDPYAHEWFWDVQGIVFTTQGMHPEAIDSFRRMATLAPWSRCYMAVSLAALGELSEARAVLAPLRAIETATTAAKILEQRMPHADLEALRRLTEVLQGLEADRVDARQG